MKNYVILILIFSLLLWGCSIDWNDDKESKIWELEQKIELDNKSNEIKDRQLEMENRKIELDISKQEEESRKNVFSQNLECVKTGNRLKYTYSNIISGYYNEDENRCYVKYKDVETLLITDWPSDAMEPIIEKPKKQPDKSTSTTVIQLQKSITLYWRVRYQEIIDVLNSFKQPNLANLIIKLLLEGDVKSTQIIMWMKEWEKIPIESRADWYFWQNTLKYLKEVATWPPK